MKPASYAELARSTIQYAQVDDVLRRHPEGAIALERLARAAGATRWFALQHVSQLDDLSLRLSPGSSLSFYFDGRLASRKYSPEVRRQILTIAERDKDAVVGFLSADGLAIEVTFVAGEDDLEQFVQTLSPNAVVFVGAFPARDNDGENAITVDLPDLDGVVRKHPH